ncbi:MAG: site-specific DNA-methyltransferase, partial [Oscillospiraceae bacterium]
RDDGVIFISIDDNEVDNLKKLCNEVFGEENFVSQFIWERAFSPKNDAKFVSTSHDYVFMYVKSIETFNVGRLDRTEEMENRYKNPDDDPRGSWTSGDLSVKTYNVNTDYEITTPSGRIVTPPHGACWRVSKERFAELVKDNRIWFGESGDNVPRLKRFASDVQDGMVPTSILFYKDVGHSQQGRQELKKLFDDKGYFDGPKPVGLINRLLKIGNVIGDDIILDFFSGSATTAHAVMRLNDEDGGNRRYILVQLPEVCDENSEAYKAGYKNICEIGKERIRRAGKKLMEIDGQMQLDDAERQLMDVGFKVYKLDTSNLKTWDSEPIADDDLLTLYDRMNQMISRVKPDRSDMDMVSEIMLKLGVPLTYPVGRNALNGKAVYAVGADCLLLICLAENVQPTDVEAMAEYAPAKVIISRDSFTDDTAMANAYYILRDKGIELKLV